ncbi:trypsin-like peptidase domain-containing protein [Streptomyces sp. NPDC006307]|uniref:VMAP-C domain-containing protein n=1 Tax=Streptomyces sp. NPDC006307 TaxID=3156748 RepID=UPI0033A8A64D
MTASPAWHARVELDGVVAGSGFLVTADSVLTCAHVVGAADRAEVSFPGAPGLERLTATVAVRGSWASGPLDRGDVAVLRLDRPVDIEPAAFAGLDEPYPAHGRVQRIVAYGFPDGYDQDGVQSELRVTSHQLIQDEWAQLESWSGYGQEPAHGFSGAAAMLEGSGTVVGMVTAHDPAIRNGRMIPARVLVRHWPALADLVPTPGYPAAEKRRLRELVERVAAPDVPVDRLMRSAVSPLGIAPPPAGGLNELWHAVWYLLSEAPPRRGALPLAELAVRLADLVPDEGLGGELRAWARAHRARHGAPAPAARTVGQRERRRWSPILVEIERSGADRNVVLAEVSAYREGGRLLVGEKRLPKGQVRSWVLDRIDEAFGEIDTDGRELIAFSLPRDWLNQPVDRWTRRKDKEAPLGCHSPVVVMDHQRRARERLQFRLRRMWEDLDRQDGSSLHRIGCDGPYRPARLSVLLQDVYAPVGFARPPRAARDRELHGAALDAPAPIVLWPRRTDCPPGGACHGACDGNGFLDRLAAYLSALPPAELPERILQLRKEAFLHEGPQPHWAAELSLLWEDPRWFPEIRPLRRSPVG